MEEWRDIEGYEGIYQVSNKGRVKALERYVPSRWGGKQFKKGRILVNVNTQGYLYVGLKKDGVYKRYRVHRLVANAFIPNPNGYTEINHKDENPKNNAVENLEWCDRTYNINYGTRNEKVREHFTKMVCKMSPNGKILKVYKSMTEACNDSGAQLSSISNCCNNKAGFNTANGFKWQFYE